jgi:hypothetical protein
MRPRAYAMVGDLRADLRIPPQADEAPLLRALEDVSAAIDDALGRRVAPVEHDTVVVDGSDARLLWVPDILVVETIEVDMDGDGTYELAVPPASCRRILDGMATVGLVLGPEAPIARWPDGPQAVRITGTTGYAGDVEAVGTLAADIGAGDDSIPLPPGITAGATLVIGGERIYVRSSAGGVVRGIAGTSAAAHAAGSPVYRERYPRAIERAALLQAARLQREALVSYAPAGPADVAGPTLATAYPMVRDLLAPHRRLVGVTVG